MIREGAHPHRRFSPSYFHEVKSGKRLAFIRASVDAVLIEAFTVTCKIVRQVIGQGRVVLRVSGLLTGDDVNTLRTLLEQESDALTLDLKHVLSVDDEAVRLLASHESNGVTLDNCPLYIREWIRREREAT